VKYYLMRSRPSGGAQRLIAASFFVLAAYVGAEAIRTLVAGDHPRRARSALRSPALRPAAHAPERHIRKHELLGGLNHG
jgi:hypothetical protein